MDAQQRIGEQLAKTARANYESIIAPALRGLETIQRAFRESIPSNWHDLDSGELRAALEGTESDGICLVWAPRVEVVRLVLAEDTTEKRLAVLAASSSDVLDHLAAVLAESDHTDVPNHADAHAFAAEALDAARDHHWTAAQTLPASWLGQVLHGVLNYPVLGGLGAAYKKFAGQDIEEVTLRALKLTMLEIATAKALTNMDIAGPGFNRHGTQQRDRAFFSKPNAIAGLLLLIGWLRELRWLRDHHPEVFGVQEEGEEPGGGQQD